MSKPKTPTKLETAGKRLWSQISDSYELRADEYRVLEDACREADLVQTLTDGLEGQTLTVKGSQGQDVIHPLISELRQHRATLAALLRQLKLPDESGSDSGEALSAKNRAAAQARWSRRGA